MNARRGLAAWVYVAAVAAVGGLLMPGGTVTAAEPAAALGLPPLPAALAEPPAAQVALGEKLFFDRRLSANGTLSCAMCHVPAQGFTVNELRTRAKDALLTMEIAKEENAEGVSQNLRDVDGLTPELIAKLNEAGINTRDDLADLATDELTDITGQSSDEATALIMTARAHWFTDEASAAAAPAAAEEQ